MARAPRRQTVAELRGLVARLRNVLGRGHLRVREMASRWHDHLPPEARAELHDIANELLAPLLDESSATIPGRK